MWQRMEPFISKFNMVLDNYNTFSALGVFFFKVQSSLLDSQIF